MNDHTASLKNPKILITELGPNRTRTLIVRFDSHLYCKLAGVVMIFEVFDASLALYKG